MKIGSLFAGYGGLEMGVQAVFPDAEPAWHCEWDDAPSKVLATHWPDVPNHRDVTAVDWDAVKPVDILTGGFPCQDVSHAGRRQGLIRDGEGRTRSGLWGEMLKAIDTIRPPLVVAENVRGLLSAKADSDVEPCPFCLGDDGASPMRALGAVLADLADIGFDASWTSLRAADVGAPHGRFRVFILAWPVEDVPTVVAYPDGARGEGGAGGRVQQGRESDGRGSRDVALLPTPVADNSRGLPQSGTDYASLPNAIFALLPTPSAADGMGGHERRGGARGDELLLNGAAKEAHRDPATFGAYAPAIAQWEQMLGRPAPAPTEATGRDGGHRLSPAFVEWLMGLPDGHVTDPAIGLTRNQQLKALGNGVVPQQAAAALAHLLAMTGTTRLEEAA